MVRQTHQCVRLLNYIIREEKFTLSVAEGTPTRVTISSWLRATRRPALKSPSWRLNASFLFKTFILQNHSQNTDMVATVPNFTHQYNVDTHIAGAKKGVCYTGRYGGVNEKVLYLYIGI